MQIDEFKSIVMTFSDPGTDLLFDRTHFLISVNDKTISAKIATRSGDVFIDEGSGEQPASRWIINRLAQLPLLAARLKEMVVTAEHFVSPSAVLLPTLERGPQGDTVHTNDALATALETLNERNPLETMVLYITSDAGEGKTSLINALAKVQAQRFSENATDWLLVPITLGGRHFLRFDDITVGALQNRYRFPFLYYSSFLALVKMGVIVPAFDGFEEMFVENSSGEALSAMGILVGSLDSHGSMVLAARKAYFDFENPRSRERLFDTIRTCSVGFGKLELQRWDRAQFMTYCEKRVIPHPEELYRCAIERLGSKHPLLTRAVLVKRLVDVATANPSLDKFLDHLHRSGTDFFSVFVRGLIEREANEKWIDRSGDRDVGSALLTVEEHFDLLSQIAVAMWESRVNFIKRDNLEFVADYFSVSNRKSTLQAQQIRERIRGHALLVSSANASSAYEFDHDEFREFFLGEGIARQILPFSERAKAEVFGSFRRGVLTRHTQHAIIRAVTRDTKVDKLQVVLFLLDVAELDAQTSYTQENCSDIIIRIVSGLQGSGQQFKKLSFGENALRDRKLTGLIFHDCYFSPTSLEQTVLRNCTFSECTFAQVRIFNSTQVHEVLFNNCTVDALVSENKSREIWVPSDIRQHLEKIGVRFHATAPVKEEMLPEPEVDAEIRDIEKIVRYFGRSTHISEGVMHMKLGVRGQSFIDHTLPLLLRTHVMQEIENRGGGDQRRFRFGVPLQQLNSAIAGSLGSFVDFLQQFEEDESTIQ
ncbi:hypothetical protein KKD52_00040 [Myxococcota bacterium]|nr:hypothetical protein [Myxococcota bacterium]MBU1508719.1 hypothetical protein [Myxococcota bacterium]